MNKNKLKTIWSNGGVVVNGWLHIPNPWSAEIMAHAGWDSLTVDFQHGFHTVQDALSMFQAMNTTGVVPMARVPWNDPVYIQRLLDAGALGIICPMVNTRAECEQFVASCRYFPAGIRSAGPTRPRLAMGNDYLQWANDAILTIAMIETATAIDNLEDILSVDGLDAVYIGPGDLGMTLGVQGADTEDPTQLAIYDKLLARCSAHGVVAGLHTGSAEYAKRMIARGFQFITINTDSGLLLSAAQSAVSGVKGKPQSQASTY